MRKSDLFTLSEVFHLRQYVIQSVLPARPTIIDAGANIGLASIWFLARYPGASLHAFEPEDKNYRLLSANLNSESNVQLTKAALGESNGRAILHLSYHGATHSIAGAEQFLESEAKQEIVEQINLADYLQQQRIEAIDLLKLDVEGSELDLLKGLGDRVRKVRVICGEVHEQIVPPEEFFGLLERYGFTLLWRKSFEEDLGQRVHHFEAARR
jgi:FkbM family methyltransferase